VVGISFHLIFQLSPDADLEFCWTDAEVADLHDNTTVLIAADGTFARSAFHNYTMNSLAYYKLEKVLTY